jgi:hypothetical protein
MTPLALSLLPFLPPGESKSILLPASWFTESQPASTSTYLAAARMGKYSRDANFQDLSPFDNKVWRICVVIDGG